MSSFRMPPSKNQVLFVVAFGVFVAADDLTVVSTMLRQIIFDLEIPLPDDLNRAAWIVNAYLIAYVAVMPFTGRLSDILGRRAVYVGALILFLAGSIWVPFTPPDLNRFVIGRILTAIGGGAMVPVAMAVVGDLFPERRRASAMGVLGAVDTAGWVWGPLYGALLVRFLSWRWQFYLNIPLSLAGIVAAWWALDGLPRPERRQRIDWLGAVVLTSVLLMFNVALLNSGDVQSAGGFASLDNNSQPDSGLLYVLAAAGTLLFIGVQWFLGRRLEGHEPGSCQGGNLPVAPLIDLKLFRRTNFTPAVAVNFLVGCVLIIAMVNVPLLVNVLEFDVQSAALTSGYLLSGLTAAMAVTAYAGGRLTEHMGYRPVTLAGLLLCVLGFAWMGLTWNGSTPYLRMAGHLILLGLGFGLVIAPIGTAVINAAPAGQRGIAASMVIVLRLMGMSVGLSGLTAWGLRRFDLVRREIVLPDLPLSDPVYQEALVAGLTGATAQVLAETFLVSAVIASIALIVSLGLRRPDPTTLPE